MVEQRAQVDRWLLADGTRIGGGARTTEPTRHRL